MHTDRTGSVTTTIRGFVSRQARLHRATQRDGCQRQLTAAEPTGQPARGERTPVTIVAHSTPIAAPASRMRLVLQSFRSAALDAIAECGRGVDCLARAAQADAVHDRQLVSAARVAALGGQEADVRGCGCAARFDRVGRLVADAQVADTREDSFMTRAADLFGRGVIRMRAVAGAADRLIGGKA